MEERKDRTTHTGIGIRVIDFHAHFPVAPVTGPTQRAHPIIETYACQRRARMCAEWSFGEPEPLAVTDEEIAEAESRWAAEVERHILTKVVFVTGRDNETLGRIVARHPAEFAGMAHHSPTARDALEALKHAVEALHFVGYKMFGPRVEVPFEHPSLRPIWEYCAERRLPVLIHFGILGHAGGVVYHPRMSPLTIYPVAMEFPEIPFVIPHFGCGYPQDLMQLCWSCPNVYVDTSGSNQWTRWMPYDLDLKKLFRMFYETIGPKRIIFGSDSSWFPRGFAARYLQDQIRECRCLGMKDEDLAAIFCGNAARLMNLQ